MTAAQARRVDVLAIEELGLPGIVLMENAAINASAAVLDLLDVERDLAPGGAVAAVVCGSGNNGGDGYAVARHLHNWGVAVRVFAARPPRDQAGDAAVNEQVCRAMGLEVRPIDADGVDAFRGVDVVIDALLGTGFEGELRPEMAELVLRLNELDALVVSLDVPSGLDADTGEPRPVAVRADLTVTFAAEKVGFAAPGAREFLGKVVVADIGVPEALIERASRDG
ncbi:MAG: NAD(P)H-hydrate epimerase [Planctomycetota bacterium]